MGRPRNRVATVRAGHRTPEERACVDCGGPVEPKKPMSKKRFCAACRVLRDRASDARSSERYRLKMNSMTDEEFEQYHRQRAEARKKPAWSGDWDRV